MSPRLRGRRPSSSFPFRSRSAKLPQFAKIPRNLPAERIPAQVEGDQAVQLRQNTGIEPVRLLSPSDRPTTSPDESPVSTPYHSESGSSLSQLVVSVHSSPPVSPVEAVEDLPVAELEDDLNRGRVRERVRGGRDLDGAVVDRGDQPRGIDRGDGGVGARPADLGVGHRVPFGADDRGGEPGRVAGRVNLQVQRRRVDDDVVGAQLVVLPLPPESSPAMSSSAAGMHTPSPSK